MWKGTVSVEFRAIHQKLCGDCTFPQNFDTRKLSEISVFHAVSSMAIPFNHHQSIQCREYNEENNYFRPWPFPRNLSGLMSISWCLIILSSHAVSSYAELYRMISTNPTAFHGLSHVLSEGQILPMFLAFLWFIFFLSLLFSIFPWRLIEYFVTVL